MNLSLDCISSVRPAFGCLADSYRRLWDTLNVRVHSSCERFVDDSRKMEANQMWFNSFIFIYFFWHWLLLHSWINNFRWICFVWKQIILLTIEMRDLFAQTNTCALWCNMYWSLSHLLTCSNQLDFSTHKKEKELNKLYSSSKQTKQSDKVIQYIFQQPNQFKPINLQFNGSSV